MPNVVIQNQPMPTGNTAVIQNFFSTAIDLFFRHSPSHPARNAQIRVHYGKNGPVTSYGGNNVTGWDIHLTAENDDWCKHVYQFAHEVCHVFAQMQQSKHPNQWFEESVCEAASLYALQTISEMGATKKGPCVNLFTSGRPFHEAMKDYVNRYLQDSDRQAATAELKKGLKYNEAQLRIDPYWEERKFNNVVANKLFPFFVATPKNWAAIEFLNTIPCSITGNSFGDYLANWKRAVAKEHRPFIKMIERILLRSKLCRIIASCIG
jgi:hypothetical protein